ncbi:MAG: DUF1499 domain-containing protein [Pseudomonadales bacterium]
MVILRILFYCALLAALLIALYFSYLGYQSRRGSPPGLVQGQLAPCPPKPNCVSSTAATTSKHYMAPFETTADDAIARAAITIESLGGKVEQRTDNYLSASFKSSLFGFVDDVELLWNREAQKLNFRSASRVGHSDMGANRKRMLALGSALKRNI